MATLLNDRNELLYSSSSRVTGAVVTVTAGAATSLIFPKPADGTTTIVPVPAALTLTATATGYVTPSYTWSYRFGDSGSFTSITGTTNSVAFTTDTAFATSAGTNTIVQFKVVVAETASNIGVNQAEYTLSIPILREGTNGINNILLSIYKRTATNVAPTFTTQDLAATSTYTFSSSQVVGQPTGWTQTIPAASGGAYLWISQVQVASVTSSYAFSNALYSSPVLFSQDGISGTSPLVYDIVTSAPVIVKDAADAATSGTYASITIQGKKYDGSTTTNYGWVTVTGNGDTEATTASDTASTAFTLSPTNTAGKSSYTIKLYNQATVSGAILLDTQTISVVYKGTNGTNGLSAITAIVSNEAHVFPAASTGAVSSYTGSGTIIRVYEGATELIYDNVGTDASRWKVVSGSPVNITAGTIADSGDYATVGVHSGVADGTDASSITYTITGKNSAGTAFTITKTQTFSKSKAGTNGTPGTNTALIYAYKRSATAPTDNPGIVDYSFSTNAITTATLSNSWSKTIPSGTDPLYVVIATAASTTSTDNVLAAEWTQPVLLVKNGTDGTNGTNSATVYLYARNSNSSTAPSLTTTGSATYTFATGALSGTIPSGWTNTIPAESNGSVVWVVQATAAATTETDDIPNTSWSTPRVLGQQGSNGSPGTRGTRDLYSADANYSSTYVYLTNAAGPASYAVLATTLIASATSGSTPTTPITGDRVTFSNNVTKTFTGSIAGYVLTVTSATAGSVVIGQTLSGTGIANGTVITSFISGTNGAAGTYGVTASQTTSSTTITAISGNYVYTLTYDGTSWKTPGTVIDGSLLVTGTVTASKINTNGLTIKDSSGNTIFSAGVPLTSTYLSTAVNNDIAAGVSAGATATAASAAAASASSAASAAATAAAAKLSKAGGDILTGVISTDAVTVGGLRAGDLVWDATGARTSGKGVALTQKGIVGHNGSNVTFSVNSTTGDATFAGTLSVASASTGARTEISNTVIKVFDGTRLRVQIGDLSA